jgi:hypothetical protein
MTLPTPPMMVREISPYLQAKTCVPNLVVGMLRT